MPESPACGSRDPAAGFRQVMAHIPTGVSVVATRDGDTPYGMSVNSFTSVSLDPLLVLFCASIGSMTWGSIRRSGCFAVSVLATHQEYIGRKFASPAADRFAGERWSVDWYGQPVLDDAVAWLDCIVDEVVRAGDHDIVLSRVLDARARADAQPLVFYRSAYVGLSRDVSAIAL